MQSGGTNSVPQGFTKSLQNYLARYNSFTMSENCNSQATADNRCLGIADRAGEKQSTI